MRKLGHTKYTTAGTCYWYKLIDLDLQVVPIEKSMLLARVNVYMSCMYRVITYSRVRINRIRLPILLVMWSSDQGKYMLPYSRTRLRIKPRETGSAFPSHPVNSPRSRAESLFRIATHYSYEHTCPNERRTTGITTTTYMSQRT